MSHSPSDPEAPDLSPSDPALTRRNFYGRRHGKTLRQSQKGYLEDLAHLRPKGVTFDENPDRRPIAPGTIFGDDRPLWLEIGFGGGEHLVHMACLYPQVGVIGCEPFINGVAMLLGKIRAAGVENVSILPGDARDLMDVLPDAAIDRAFLNYPDPWPKARHHRRRFVTPEHLEPLARIMRPGAEFRIATDIPDYVRQAREEVPAAGFTPVADSDQPWDDWLSTRYEQKALREGRVPHYLTYRR
ncbi:tRNA (guanine(46)-N(7))-methyltransferase TrmB [Paracoccus pacificus]|uniref:tRNA (guanine-N(7)-)-methyltransferase n=1 Tax=Paracoccus pacificus TaxID=1463598 RepID=A0ABW4R566_9RHOB